MDGTEPKPGPGFSISRVRTVHVHSVCSERTLLFWFVMFVRCWAMFAHIRQSVREQPDTGYRKSLPAYTAAAPGVGGEFVFWGGG